MNVVVVIVIFFESLLLILSVCFIVLIYKRSGELWRGLLVFFPLSSCFLVSSSNSVIINVKLYQ
jgi:4-amino-4-deoxy-L-arabinose transferase-like glycosyltransferase